MHIRLGIGDTAADEYYGEHADQAAPVLLHPSHPLMSNVKGYRCLLGHPVDRLVSCC